MQITLKSFLKVRPMVALVLLGLTCGCQTANNTPVKKPDGTSSQHPIQDIRDEAANQVRGDQSHETKDGMHRDGKAIKDEPSRDGEHKTIADLVAKEHRFNTLAKLIKSSNLVDTLKGNGPYTLFAPTNSAFDELPSGTLNSLQRTENGDKLRKILRYHVVSGSITHDELMKLKSLRTIDGQMLRVTVKDHEVYVNDAKVESKGTKIGNGMVYPINAVLLPPGQGGTQNPSATQGQGGTQGQSSNM